MSRIQDALRKIRSSGPGPLNVAENVARSTAEPPEKGPGGPSIGGALGSLQIVAGNEPVFVSIDALRDAGMIVPKEDSQLLASQMREIKRPLLANAFGKRATKIPGGNLLLVSSALAGEGKSFISLNLALSIALEPDHSVVLVDADVAKPRLTDAFDATGKKGLLDYLEDSNLTVGSILLPTSISGLSFIPAGKPRANSTELLSGSRMDELIQRLHAHADRQIAVFDAPPILQTTESKVLADLVGQIVLVVHAEKTPQSAVINAVSVLDNRKPLNVILNRVGSKMLHSRYIYGSAYNESEANTNTKES